MNLYSNFLADSSIILARRGHAPVAGGIAPDLEHDRPAAHFAILDVTLRIGTDIDHDTDAFPAIRATDANGGIRAHSAALVFS